MYFIETKYIQVLTSINLMKTQFYLTIFLALTTCFAFGQDKSKTYLFVGSYTSGEKTEGIYVYVFNNDTGELKEVEKRG